MTDGAASTDDTRGETVGLPDLQFANLVEGEVALENLDEFYFRQCHPNFIINGIPSTQIFGDFPSDDGKLSGNRGESTTPAQAFAFHTETLGNKSAGTWGVTVAEVVAAQSRVVDDTEAPTVRPPDPVPPGHSYVDMRHLTSRERKRLRSQLHRVAVDRGRVFPDETGLLDIPASD